MKLNIDAYLKNISLQKFDWDATNIKIIVNIKNNYPMKIFLTDLKINLINSAKEKFAYIKCDDNIIIKSKDSNDIIFDTILYNKETSNFISNFINLKESIFTINIISGKLKIFSILNIDLKNKTKNINILDIINFLHNKHTNNLDIDNK